MTVFYLQGILLWVFWTHFLFFLATQKRQSHYAKATVAELPSAPYTVSGNLHAEVRAAAVQPRAT